MSETCLGEGSRISKHRKTRRGKRWRNSEEKRKFIDEYMKQKKHRVAPSNTTQFLIEDREKIEPILKLSPTFSVSSNEENEFKEVDAELDNFNEQYFLNDFERTYRQLSRDNLYSFSKPELLQKVKELQIHRDNLEKEKQMCCTSSDSDPIGRRFDSLKRKFLQSRKENDSLMEEN